MKWIIAALVAIIIVAIIRRISRETTISGSTTGFEPPTIGSSGVLRIWEQRAPLPFDEFYSQYYADSGIPADDVHKVLDMIASATKVPEDRLRPDDRLEDLKPGAMRIQLAFLKRVLETIHKQDSTTATPAWRQDTVDDVIRTLGPYGQQAHSAAGG